MYLTLDQVFLWLLGGIVLGILAVVAWAYLSDDEDED